VKRVSLDFNDPPVAVLGQKAAARRAFPAGGGVPGCLPGDDIFRGDDVGDELPYGFRGAPCGGCGPGESNGFQEVPAGEFAHKGAPKKDYKEIEPKVFKFFSRIFYPEFSFDFGPKKMRR
jgi:hypothetical protein